LTIPLNAWHQLSTIQAGNPRATWRDQRPAVINPMGISIRIHTKYDFKTAFRRAGLLQQQGRTERPAAPTNFVADAVNLPLRLAKGAARGGHIRQYGAGIDENAIFTVPHRTYKKAHAHGPARTSSSSRARATPHVARRRRARRYDWQAGTMIVPPNMWFHQHFNRHGARALSGVQARSHVHSERTRGSQGLDRRRMGRRPDRLCGRKAGDSELFTEALAKHDLKPRMEEAYRAELADPRPKRPDSGSGVARNFPAQPPADDCRPRVLEQELMENLVWRRIPADSDLG